MTKILVTGGAGYIGSFITRKLRDEGFEVFVLDNFSQGHRKAISDFKVFEIDLVSQKEKLSQLFQTEKFDGVIHMASFIQMGESFRDPYKYFNNNLIGAMNLFETMAKANCRKIVFSSSAGVYGTPKTLPIKEEDPKNPENPYGETKLMIERMLYWNDCAHALKSIAIRYFNAAGADLDGSIGEDHPDESHLIPIAIKAQLTGGELTINGTDFDTPDGTCVRDYIHVLDLADIHVLAIKKLLEGVDSNQYNAGTGEGYSNKQIAEGIKKVGGDFKINFGSRRPGDAAALYANCEKIKKDFNWQPKYGLKEIIESAYSWHKNNPNGYEDRYD